MVRAVAVTFLSVVSLLGASTAHAQPRSSGLPPGYGQFSRHDPSSPNYVDMTPGGFARRNYGAFPGPGHHFGGWNSSPPWFGGWWGWRSSPWVTGYNYGFAPWGYSPYAGPFVPFPVVTDGQFFGPEAAREFAFGPTPQAEPVFEPVERGEGFGVVANNAQRIVARRPVRVSNDLARAASRRFINMGDAKFAEQKYSDAASNYRKAVKEAPDLIEPFVHQAFANLALGRYEESTRLLRRALELDPEFPRSNFTLDRLYGQNQLAKTAHLEALALAAEEKPDSPDLLFLVGVDLYLDGKPDRSRTFFERAASLTADRAHIDLFLQAFREGDAKN